MGQVNEGVGYKLPRGKCYTLGAGRGVPEIQAEKVLSQKEKRKGAAFRGCLVKDRRQHLRALQKFAVTALLLPGRSRSP